MNKNGLHILAVNDKKAALQEQIHTIKTLFPHAVVHSCKRAEEALNGMQMQPYDIVFLDSNFVDMDMIQFSRKLQNIAPNVRIIFSETHTHFSEQTSECPIAGHLIKPITEDTLLQEVQEMNHSVSSSKKKDIWIQTFGIFELFIRGESVKFKYKKTKELLACLVNEHGAFCTNEMLIETLWEYDADAKKKNSYLRTLRRDLILTLRMYQCEDIIITRRGVMALAVHKVSCDYYEYLSGRSNGRNAYHGEYMAQYSWAETTNGVLYQSLQ